MTEIPKTPKEREEWLKDSSNRDSIKRMGAGSIYYRGDLSDVDSIEIIVSTRTSNVGGGYAHFGGLGEDEDKVDGDILLTGIRNALREGKEEMEELLGYQPELKEADYSFLYAANDDKFFINNGKGFAIDARIHMCKLDEKVWEDMFPNGTKLSGRHENHKGFEETEKAEMLSFKQALTHQKDYHYPHEYFSLWVMAAKHMDVDIIALAKESKVDFTKLAKDMFITVADLEDYLGSSYKGKLQAYEDSNNTIKNRKPNGGPKI